MGRRREAAERPAEGPNLPVHLQGRRSRTRAHAVLAAVNAVRCPGNTLNTAPRPAASNGLTCCWRAAVPLAWPGLMLARTMWCGWVVRTRRRRRAGGWEAATRHSLCLHVRKLIHRPGELQHSPPAFAAPDPTLFLTSSSVHSPCSHHKTPQSSIPTTNSTVNYCYRNHGPPRSRQD